VFEVAEAFSAADQGSLTSVVSAHGQHLVTAYDPFKWMLIDSVWAGKVGSDGVCITNSDDVGAVIVGPDGLLYFLESDQPGDDAFWDTSSMAQGLIIGDSVSKKYRFMVGFAAATGATLPIGPAVSPQWYSENFWVDENGRVWEGEMPPGRFVAQPGDHQLTNVSAEEEARYLAEGQRAADEQLVAAEARLAERERALKDAGKPKTDKQRQHVRNLERSVKNARKDVDKAKEEAVNSRTDKTRGSARAGERNRQIKAGGTTAVAEMAGVGVDASMKAANEDDGYYAVRFQTSKDGKKRRAVFSTYQKRGDVTIVGKVTGPPKNAKKQAEADKQKRRAP
jgi:hypothetical protein